jgi:hypothetical protein
VSKFGLITLGFGAKKFLTELKVFFDGEQEIHSFTGDIFKCNAFYNQTHIYQDQDYKTGWFIIFGILLAVVFTLVLNSYWPILLSMYNTPKKLVKGINNNNR